MPKRPSSREIYNKVRDGLAAVQAGRRGFAVTKHFTVDLEAFDLEFAKDYWKIIELLLGEILVADPVQCYAGGFPPQKSYEAAIKNEELWAYAWYSPSQRKRMYLKFVLKDRNRAYFHVDCHEENPK